MSACSCKSPASMSLLKGSVSVLATLGKNKWVVWDFVQGICHSDHSAGRLQLSTLQPRSCSEHSLIWMLEVLPLWLRSNHVPLLILCMYCTHWEFAKKRCGLVVTSSGASAENLPPSSHCHRLPLLPAPPTTRDCAGTESFSGTSLLPYPFGEIPTRQFIPPDMDTKYEQTYAGPSNSAHVSQMTAFSSEPEMAPGALTLPRFLSNQSKG